MSQPIVRDAYTMSEDVGTKIHNAALILKGVERLIEDGITNQSPEKTKELLEILWQLVEVTATYIEEANDVAGQIAFALSGAHQR